jgi:hypothetical protein
MSFKFAVLTASALMACGVAQAKPDLWYQPSIGAQVSEDHEAMYLGENRAFTESVLQRTQVYMISRKLWMDRKQRIFFMNNVVPILKAQGVSIAINTPAAVWMSCRTPERIAAALKSEVAVVKAIEGATGLKVSHIALQSIMSKPLPPLRGDVARQLPNCHSRADYNMDKRVTDVIRYVRYFHLHAP